MFMIDYRHLGWWYWLLTAVLLAAGLAGYTDSFPLAIGLTVVQLTHFAIRERSFRAFPVQVREGYLVLLLLCWPAPMNALYILPLAGTCALLIFGYCPMARMLSLLPWNRSGRLDLAALRRAFLTPPVHGSILQRP
jgi:hypothetical protein